MKITIEMPAVQACSVAECAYNAGSRCHSKAITIGDGVHPGCDTFLDAGRAGHTHIDVTAGVGACKVTGCRYNTDFECGATSINVAITGAVANCMTYAAR